jgi:hypothetical protein
MDSIAMIAARICGRSVSENQKPVAEQDETAGSKRPWRRAPRTKAALAIKSCHPDFGALECPLLRVLALSANVAGVGGLMQLERQAFEVGNRRFSYAN